MSRVLEFSFQGMLNRASIPIEEDKPTFADLKVKARDIFNIPSLAQIQIRYIDAEGDVVTMTNDKEYRDACVQQALNPLKLKIQVVGSTSELVESGSPSFSTAAMEHSKKSSLKEWWPLSWLVSWCLDGPLASDKLSLIRWSLFERPEATLTSVVHQQVQCDYCGMLPIEGPRYSSITTPDYDLCTMCFEEVGNKKFYIRLDAPASMPHLTEIREGFGQRINDKYSEVEEDVDVQGIMFSEKLPMVIHVANQKEQNDALEYHQALEQNRHEMEAGRIESMNEPTTTAIARSRDAALRREIGKNAQIKHGNASSVQRMDNTIGDQAAWNSVLCRDFQSLGFHDMQLNRRLLLKHKGSITKAVKELIDMEKSS